MSIRAALIAIVVCVVLGLAAWWLSVRGSAPPPVVAAPLFEAGRIGSLGVLRTGENARQIVRSEIGPWILRGESSWPVETVRVRAAASLIDQLMRAETAADPGDFVSTTKIVAEDQSRNQVTIDLADSVVGGRLFVRVLASGDATFSPRIAKADFAGVFTPQGLDAWRTTTVFTALAEQPTRIEMKSTQHSTVLRRNLGRWGLERSPPVPADAERVKALIARLAVLKIERFLDGNAAATGDLEHPAATISVSTDVRTSPDDPKRSIVQTLRIGNAADAAASTVVADLKAVWDDSGETVWGPQAFAIPVAMIADLTADPARIVARVPLSAPAADVGVIRLSKPGDAKLTAVVEWKRTLDGWSVTGPTEGPTEAIAGGMAGHGAALVELLTAAAANVSFDAPKEASALATLSVWSAGGTLLEVVELHTVPSPEGEQTWTRVGDVWRMGAMTPAQSEARAAIEQALTLP